MATEQSFIEYVLDQADLGDRLRGRKMFGEYGFHLDGRSALTDVPGTTVGRDLEPRRGRSTNTRYLQVPLFLQTPEQQSMPSKHGSPRCPHNKEHSGSAAQSGSSQSVFWSQSLSQPSSQMDSVAGGVPQSSTQSHWSSPASQLPSHRPVCLPLIHGLSLC